METNFRKNAALILVILFGLLSGFFLGNQDISESLDNKISLDNYNNPDNYKNPDIVSEDPNLTSFGYYINLSNRSARVIPSEEWNRQQIIVGKMTMTQRWQDWKNWRGTGNYSTEYDEVGLIAINSDSTSRNVSYLEQNVTLPESGANVVIAKVNPMGIQCEDNFFRLVVMKPDGSDRTVLLEERVFETDDVLKSEIQDMQGDVRFRFEREVPKDCLAEKLEIETLKVVNYDRGFLSKIVALVS